MIPLLLLLDNKKPLMKLSQLTPILSAENITSTYNHLVFALYLSINVTFTKTLIEVRSNPVIPHPLQSPVVLTSSSLGDSNSVLMRSTSTIIQTFVRLLIQM